MPTGTPKVAHGSIALLWTARGTTDTHKVLIATFTFPKPLVMKDLMLVLHFIGLAMGLGTSFGFMFLGIASSRMEPEKGRAFMVNALALSTMGHVGLALLLVSGIYLLWPFLPALGDMPLLQAKLALFVLLGALIGIISGKARKARSGDPEAQLKAIAPLGRLSLLTTLAIVVLAVLNFH
ncbi:MAG: hypothetical protein IPL52_09090 [Flavobacteriales bacterium]|nr:hypothetical protein [Flavobacteriales bacterium]